MVYDVAESSDLIGCCSELSRNIFVCFIALEYLSIVMANSSSILDRVLSDLKKSDDVALLKTFEELCGIYNSSRFLMPEEHFPLIGRSLYRDVNAETVYLPHHVKADNTKPSVALR